MTRRRAVARVLATMLSEVFMFGECLCVLATPWRLNEYGQWKHGPLGRVSMRLICWSMKAWS